MSKGVTFNDISTTVSVRAFVTFGIQCDIKRQLCYIERQMKHLTVYIQFDTMSFFGYKYFLHMTSAGCQPGLIQNKGGI
jgi:hypothetical protein